MPDYGFDIRAEVARVRGELVAFRDVCLPALLKSAEIAGYIDDLSRPFSSWQETANRLLDALSDQATGNNPLPPDEADCAKYLFQSVTASSYQIRDGRISWRIELAVNWDLAAQDVLYRPSGGLVSSEDPVEELRRDLTEARRWIMSQPPDEPALWHLLTVGLVPVTDLDPAFARRALDPETWRVIVLDDREIDDETRNRRLNLIDGYFRRVLNNSLLHVMGALACNHFEVALVLLDHPNLIGSYISMIPHYLFAVLIEKARLLHDFDRHNSIGYSCDSNSI